MKGPEDIQFSQTPGGFRIEASLASYWAILPIAFVALIAVFIIRSFVIDVLGDTLDAASLLTTMLFILILAVLGWNFLVRGLGTQIIKLDYPQLCVSVGLGRLQWTREFDVRFIESANEAPGTISGGESTPPFMAIVLRIKDSKEHSLPRIRRFAFGHYLTKQQRAFILRKLNQKLTSAA